MPHAIARIAKLKSGNIASSEQHTKRVRSVPNADPSVNNIRFIGQPETKDSPNLETLVRERIGEQTIRKNAVLCVEMLLTASPEYFRPNEPSKAGYYQPQRLEEFRGAVHQWLDNQYGDRLYEQGLIYADDKQNAVFIRRSISSNNATQISPHLSFSALSEGVSFRTPLSASPRQQPPVNSKITGATLRGTAGENNTFKGLAKGTKRSEGWFYFVRGGQSSDPINRAVLVESPIDAMSFAVLDRNDSRRTIYISTDGAGEVPHKFLRQLKNVVVAFDNDEPGQLMSLKVMSQLPNTLRKMPKAVDWNEELVNRFNWSNTNRVKEIQRQPQPEQKRDRGLSL